MSIEAGLADLARAMAAELADLRTEIARTRQLAEQDGGAPAVHFLTADGQEFLAAGGDPFIPAEA
jgi:aminoglycoside phosphotransferase